MATSTSNLGLTLPSVNDAADIAVLNSNFEKMDYLGGYGLGAYGIYCFDCNSATKNGWYRFDASTLNIAPSASQGSLFVRNAESSSGVSVYQTMWNGYWRAYRFYGPWDRTWTEWEFENPPLLANVEYRTTERVDGKAVYKKRDSNGVIMYRLDGDSTWTNGLPGAAPSGYGLGAFSTDSASLFDANTAIKSGWYRLSSSTANGIGSNCVIRVDSYGSNYCTQTAYLLSLQHNTFIQRQCVNGTWTEWEWNNPPMQLGVEYRTTERSGGAPVYAKQVYVGLLPNNAGKYTEALLPTNITPVFIQGVGVGADGSKHAIPIPSMHTYVSVDGEWGTMYVSTDSDYSNYNGYITVKYTKG